MTIVTGFTIKTVMEAQVDFGGVDLSCEVLDAMLDRWS